jgi:hypothetical protein
MLTIMLTVDVRVLANFTFAYITPRIFWPGAGVGDTILVIAVSFPPWMLDITLVSRGDLGHFVLGHLVAGVEFAYEHL